MPTLIELFDGDRAAIAGLLEAALVSIAADTCTIEANAARNHAHRLIETLHRLRGTSGTIGARRIVRLSVQLEDATARTPACVSALTRDLRAAVAVLAAEIAAYAGPSAP